MSAGDGGKRGGEGEGGGGRGDAPFPRLAVGLGDDAGAAPADEAAGLVGLAAGSPFGPGAEALGRGAIDALRLGAVGEEALEVCWGGFRHELVGCVGARELDEGCETGQRPERQPGRRRRRSTPHRASRVRRRVQLRWADG